MWPQFVHSSPFESHWVTFARDRCTYVIDNSLPTVESTAFTRQGSLVQIQPRPPFFPVFTGLSTVSNACSICNSMVNVTETSPTCVRHREYLLDHCAYNDLSSWHCYGPTSVEFVFCNRFQDLEQKYRHHSISSNTVQLNPVLSAVTLTVTFWA